MVCVSLVNDILFSSGFFSRFLLVFEFQHYYYVSIHGSIFMLEVHWAFWKIRLLFFNKFGEFFSILWILFLPSSPGTLSSWAAQMTDLIICFYISESQAALLFRFLCLPSSFFCCAFTWLTVTICYCELVSPPLICCSCFYTDDLGNDISELIKLCLN